MATDTENGMMVYQDQGMVLTYSNGTQETYQLTEAPAKTMGWVLAAKEEILNDMTLEGMLSELDRAADLIYVAYNGVVGTGVLAASVSSKQKKLADLCSDCVVMMQDFVRITNQILSRLVEAYGWLLEANEARALKVLARCATSALTIADTCGKLAAAFAELKEATIKDANDTQVLVKEEDDQVKKLKAMREEMAALLASQEQIQKDMDASLAELNSKILDATAREDKENERAFITGLVGAVAGALGSGVSAYVGAKNPGVAVANGMNRSNDQPVATKTDTGAGAKLMAEDIVKKQNAVDAAKKDLDEAEKKLTTAKELVATKETALGSVSADAKEAATKERDDAAKAKDTAQGTRDAAKKAYDAADAALTVAKAKQPSDYAGANAAGAVAGSVADSANGMAAKAEERAEGIRTERLRLIDLQLKQQEAKRQASAKIAELNSRMGSNTTETGLAQASLEALQIAVWALDNISTTLRNAQKFWESLNAFCKDLGTNTKVQEHVQDELADEDSLEERKKYYLSKKFMPSAISYLVRWVALSSICEDYVVAASGTYKKLCTNINSSPTIAEARAQLPSLKARYMQQSAEDEVRFSKKKNLLLAEQKDLLTKAS